MTKLRVLFLSLMAVVLVGCGPADATINSSVKQKLAADDTVKSAPIEATTQNKIVTLTGTVDSQQTGDRAMMMARQADGVSSVVNQMTVMQQGVGPGGHGPGMMGNGMGGVNGEGMRPRGGQGSGGMRGGQGSGGSGQAGGHGSGGSTQPPSTKKPE